MKTKSEVARGGRTEIFNAEETEVWVVYCPPPGQSSGPRKVKQIPVGGFIATNSGFADVLGPFATRDEALVCV